MMPGLPLSALVLMGAVACAISLFAIDGFRRWAVRRRIIDVANARSLHSGAVPRGAGAVIVIVTLAGLAAVWLIARAWPARTMAAYLAGAAIVAGVSWADDLRGLPPAVRFVAHVIAAFLFAIVEAPYPPLHVPLVGDVPVGWFGVPLAAGWIIWLTNAFNFMDGADALAGLQAVVAGAGWIVLGLWTGDAFIATAATLIVGATAGFLRYNWPPARVFMGDVGSAFLGYSFAALTVCGWTAHPPLAIAGVLVLWPFFFDAAFTLARRVRRGERVWEAHRSHLYQRSISRGAGHADVAIEYALAASIGVLTAVAWVTRVDPQGAILVAVAAGSALWLWVRMTARERRGQQPVVPHA